MSLVLKTLYMHVEPSTLFILALSCGFAWIFRALVTLMMLFGTLLIRAISD